MKKSYKSKTKLVHLGRKPDEYFGVVNPPVTHASTFLYPSLDAYENKDHKYRYSRMATPMSDAFEEAMAALEGGHKAISAPSGLSAITTSLLAFLKAGDHLLITDSLYPPARGVASNMLARMGVEVEFYDPLVADGIKDLIRDNTAVIYMESPGSATFEVQDVPAIVKAAKKKDIVTICDNSWAGGLLFRPLEHGVNVSVQSATKYVGGHSDIMLGFAVADGEDHYEALKKTRWDLGVCASDEQMYLALRGLRTMELRMKQCAENAMKVAEFVKERKEVQRVFYPALPDDPNHKLWQRDFSGANGTFSFLLKDSPKQAVRDFVEGLELFPIGSSWGGYESLLQPQYPKIHRSAVKWEHKGALLRLQVGLEDPEDLIADMEAGFERFNNAL